MKSMGWCVSFKSGILLDRKDLELLQVPIIEVQLSINLGSQAVLIVFSLNDPQSFADI
jgi:hypothetical protein